MSDEVDIAIAHVGFWARMRRRIMDAGPVFVLGASVLVWSEWWLAAAVLLVLTLACIPAIWAQCREGRWQWAEMGESGMHDLEER